MSSGAQADLDWAGVDSGQGSGSSVPSNAGGATPGGDGLTAANRARMTDEEILGINPPSPKDGFGGLARPESLVGENAEPVGARHAVPVRSTETGVAGVEMPAWMAALAADPKTAAEARQLWQEHQAYRASFSSADEARALKELLPGGTQEILALRDAAREVLTLRQSAETLRESAQSVERIDAAIFSGDVRAQSEVVAEMARANPAAFRSMFAEAAKVLAGLEAGGRGTEAGGRRQEAGNNLLDRRSGIQSQESMETEMSRQDAGATNARVATDTNRDPRFTNHESQITNHGFDPAAYASFERSTNDAVARDVRGSISDTLGRVLPEGIADGAAKRIGEDIFNEVHRALAADRALSEQVGEVLRDRRFGSGEQQRVASLLAGRAKQLVPSVARRVIGEWTSSVLGTARSKAARQAAATSRVDIAAAGGSLDSMPLRAMSGREVNYASMSDDEILGM
jgi:hypothetical protein